jgi:hypothetical protein
LSSEPSILESGAALCGVAARRARAPWALLNCSHTTGVDYLVVGGYALAAFGRPRYTLGAGLFNTQNTNGTNRFVVNM